MAAWGSWKGAQIFIGQFHICSHYSDNKMILKKKSVGERPFDCKGKVTRKSPEMLAPAKIPVAAGKNMENTEKNDSPFLKSGGKFSKKIFTVKKNKEKITSNMLLE